MNSGNSNPKNKHIPFEKIFPFWAGIVERHAHIVLILTAIVTALSIYYTVNHFDIDTDLNNMISDEAEFRKAFIAYNDAFKLQDGLIAVIDADTSELAMYTRDVMAKRVKANDKLFKDVLVSGGGEFFDKNGLLYLSEKELDDLSAKLAGAQPLLASIAKDNSIRGLFSLLTLVVEHLNDDDNNNHQEFFTLLDHLSDAFASAVDKKPHKPYQFSWQEIMLGKDAQKLRRQFVAMYPYLDYSDIFAGQKAIEAARAIADDLQKTYNVKIRFTGPVMLSYDDMMSIQKGSALSTLISLILIRIILGIGLGSRRLVFITYSSLIIGLIWTTGFAIFAIGKLNLVSVTFAVMFVGLGDDYFTQYAMRYRELIADKLSNREAQIRSSIDNGTGLSLSALCTVIGFFSFVPTVYSGISELGIISGVGIIISFFGTLTVLPALLTVFPLRPKDAPPFPEDSGVAAIPNKYAGSISILAIIIGIGSAFFIPLLTFDYNPLNLSYQAAESVQTAKELYKDGDTAPETLTVLAKNAEEVKELTQKLKALPEVKNVVTLVELVPQNQEEKLETIADMALFVPHFSQRPQDPLPMGEKVKAIQKLSDALKKLMLSSQDNAKIDYLVISRLYYNIERFKSLVKQEPANAGLALEELENSILFNLNYLLRMLQEFLRAQAFTAADLPQELSRLYISRTGLYRLQVFPNEDITQIEALKRFVAAVRTVAPNATDAPALILETGNAIIGAFKQASIYALIFIVLVIFVILKDIVDTFVVLIPLILAILYTAALAVIIDTPLNFANVIVIPLILGIGVNYPIHLMHRYHTDLPDSGDILSTSTARSVFYSALTTVSSFGTLAFYAHQGTASMGKLLTVSIMLTLVTTLIVLPAMLKFFKYKSRSHR
jgi:hypothetical protein